MRHGLLDLVALRPERSALPLGVPGSVSIVRTLLPSALMRLTRFPTPIDRGYHGIGVI